MNKFDGKFYTYYWEQLESGNILIRQREDKKRWLVYSPLGYDEDMEKNVMRYVATWIEP